MKERRVVAKAFATKYRQAAKKEKGRILDQFVEATGYVRRYAARILRGQGRRIGWGGARVAVAEHGEEVRRRRPRYYGPAEQSALKRIWEMLDYLSGKRLAPALPLVVEALERHGELELDKQVRAKLVKMSAATIDRLLRPEKQRLQLKGRGLTKPGTLLRHQVPIRTFEEWDEARPGFLEVDLVGHDGGFSMGDYAQSLTLTDVSTGWTEVAALPNRAQVWVFEALQKVRDELPFRLLGLDSDNGSEFINHHLVNYCQQEQITFTRSRPWRKNDNCFVEQKNYTVVRRFVGYSRYQGEEQVGLLNEVYALLSDYVNFFLPSQKLQSKQREGSRVRKRYHLARTPFQRLLELGELSPNQRAQLKKRYRGLNPADLHRRLSSLREKLLTSAPAARPPAAGLPQRLPPRRVRFQIKPDFEHFSR